MLVLWAYYDLPIRITAQVHMASQSTSRRSKDARIPQFRLRLDIAGFFILK